MIFTTFRKLYALLHRRERLQFYVLVAMITMSGIADVVGVAAVLPFLAALSDPSAITENGLLSWLNAVLEPDTPDSFLISLGWLVFATIVAGTVVKLATMYALARFSHMRKFHLGQRLLVAYLSQPYTWFLSRHSSDLVKTITQEVDQMIGGTMVPIMRILAQLVSVAFLMLFLLIVEPAIALGVLALLGGAYGLIFFVVRNLLTRFGAERVQANTERYRIAGEALGGVKELKLMGLERSYERAYRKPALRHARSLVNVQIIGELPRYGLEAITFGGMIALILFLLTRSDVPISEGGLAEVVPVLGLFAVAGLRMLPAIQNVYHSLTSLRAGQAVLDVIYQDFLALEVNDTSQVPPEGARARLYMRRQAMQSGAPNLDAVTLNDRLELREAVYTYPGTERKVLDGLNVSIPARTTVAFVGGSGAGKTTAIDVILGLLTLDGGALLIDGVPVHMEQIRDWQDMIGYVPQHIFLTDDTVASNIAFGIPRDHIDMAAVERAARMARLHDFILSDLDQGYDTFVGERGVRLSGGQRQRIGIARALYHDPNVLILDEATSALDTLIEAAIMEAVTNLASSKTIIMIAHRLSTVMNCDCIFLMEDGRVTDQGMYDALIDRNPTFRSMAKADEYES